MEMKLTDMSAIMDSVVGDSLHSSCFPSALCGSANVDWGSVNGHKENCCQFQSFKVIFS